MKNKIPPSLIDRHLRPQNSPWQYYAIAIGCCAVLVAGFFFAARQHFSSMEYGLQNSRLRRQLDELSAEKRKLLISREISMSPVELRKAVRRIGFMDTPSTQFDAVKTENPAVQRSVDGVIEAKRASASNPASKVVKTVITAPVVKSAALDKQARREMPNSKKDRT